MMRGLSLWRWLEKTWLGYRADPVEREPEPTTDPAPPSPPTPHPAADKPTEPAPIPELPRPLGWG